MEEKFFTREETFDEVIESLFSVRHGGFGAVLKVVAGIMSIGWLGDSILPFIHGTAPRWSGSAEVDFTEDIYKFLFALGWFIFYVSILYGRRSKHIKTFEYRVSGSTPQRGLIVSLSPYKDFSQKLSLPKLEIAIDEKRLNLEDFYNSANWGQLAFTVAHHSDLLQRCWICATPESAEQFSIAAKLVNYVSGNFEGRQIVCFREEIKDEIDIGEMARKVSSIYQSLNSIDSGISAENVVSNYTGGTAAMTGGIIMATLSEKRKIEYINQRYLKRLSSTLLRDIENNLAIVSSETNLTAIEKLS